MAGQNFADDGQVEQLFQVDLGGLVELLSRNLYSSSAVFVRELLQNGLDAITARAELDSAAPRRIRFITTGSTLRVTDTGVGLTFDEVKNLLSTIGASSKRDDFGFSRADYLGQFGIGLLSCFMVSNSITVYSRSAKVADRRVVRWVGRSDGTWLVDYPQPHEVPAESGDAGTTVVLEQIPGDRSFDYAKLQSLISGYGQFLPLSVTLERENTQAVTLTDSTPPWDMPRGQKARWCIENFGFSPFDMIDLEVPIAGIKGVAYVLSSGASPGQSLHHHVYLRSMLLGKKVTDILPEWAYFVRVVLNTDNLKPTASREQLFDNEILDAAREQMGDQVRAWLQQLAQFDLERFHRFTSVHINGLKSLAITDRATRDLVVSAVPFTTSQGQLTLAAIIEKYGSIRFTRTDNEFRTLETIFERNGLCVVNAGFAFDEELLAQVALDRPQMSISELDVDEVLSVLEPVSISQEAYFMTLLDVATDVMEGQSLVVEARSFDPSSLPVLFLPNGNLAGKLIEKDERDSGDDLFAGLLDSADAARSNGQVKDDAPRLIFNARSSVINELAGAVTTEKDAVKSAIRGFYVQALLAGRHPMNQQARSWSATVFTTLVSALISRRGTMGEK
ncbi:HSP90 family protein [Arcanobacterium phocisimile]|uniref:HSP90 family protein n=1 Tax=Arcanobacterium phocisimile TaxID=1302235 RepID=A0ABX7II62_9ACTO|nr:HSP90 family protein [Arcanobacterium phocisimile]QRV02114.1 HSP90 family protein [Arcanobacterium phocisimile]